MAWPPQVGELLPRTEQAEGLREKLIGYSLNASHKRGGTKALGFSSMLGITIAEVDYLETVIRRGIRAAPIIAVRPNPPYGVKCLVEFPLRGLGARSHRTVNLRTVWQFASPASPPRLLTAFPKPRIEQHGRR